MTVEDEYCTYTLQKSVNVYHTPLTAHVHNIQRLSCGRGRSWEGTGVGRGGEGNGVGWRWGGVGGAGAGEER